MWRMIITGVMFVSAVQFSTSSHVFAREVAGQGSPLSLAQAISTALVHNPQIAAAKSGLNASAEKITQAKSGFLPQINFNESFQRTDNPMWSFGAKLRQGRFTQQDFNLDNLNNPSPIDNYTSAFLLSWPIFDSGQTWYGVRQAKLANKAQGMELDRTRQAVISRTIGAYCELVLSRDSLAVIDQALTTAHTHLKIITQRYKNALTVKSDVLSAQVHIAELEQDRVTAAGRVSVAKAALSTAMGVPIKPAITPEDPLVRIDSPEETLPEWIDTAFAKRPDLAKLDFEKQMAEADIKKARVANWPSVNLNGSYEINTEDFSDSADNYTVGANVTLNLFSGCRYSSKTREALFRHQVVKDYLRVMKQRAALEVRQAYYDILSAAKRIDSAEISVERADEALRIVQDRYKAGLLPIVSLLDAEVALYRAKNNYNQALYQHVTARARLLKAAGILDKDFVLRAGDHR